MAPFNFHLNPAACQWLRKSVYLFKRLKWDLVFSWLTDVIVFGYQLFPDKTVKNVHILLMKDSELSLGVIVSCDGPEPWPVCVPAPHPVNAGTDSSLTLAFSDKYTPNNAGARIVQPPASLISSCRLLDLLISHVCRLQRGWWCFFPRWSSTKHSLSLQLAVRICQLCDRVYIHSWVLGKTLCSDTKCS